MDWLFLSPVIESLRGVRGFWEGGMGGKIEKFEERLKGFEINFLIFENSNLPATDGIWSKVDIKSEG